MNLDERFGDPEQRQSQFLACSGAKIRSILDEQVPLLNDDQQVITMTVGGNDVGLADILNACVFQWWPFSSGCHQAIETSRELIEGGFSADLVQLLKAITPKLSRDPTNPGKLYVIGYADFFNSSTTQCDSTTWAFWYNIGNKQYLNQDVRKPLNELVDAVNKRISDAVKAAGDQAIFVDWHEYAAYDRGRYCEDGVIEPAPNRPGLMFYEWDTVDPDEDVERLQQLAPNVDDGTFAGEVNKFVNWTVDRKQHHTLHESRQDPTKLESRPSMRSAETIVELDDNVERTYGSAHQPLIRVSWTRVFHPRPQTHALLANLVLDRMDLEHEKTMARMRHDTQGRPMELK
ncbi:MAG: hypothetical protein OHK93_007928 [Ramalina farinacea]|uniref:SGNH hydrolase-type esterase domain-containing protein n=1 Tax=Ramalina farinacea TaxID=258253 RepID=A0AA43QLG0_9LECA|nr:hypothetical protein [Ramalina farinacea]